MLDPLMLNVPYKGLPKKRRSDQTPFAYPSIKIMRNELSLKWQLDSSNLYGRKSLSGKFDMSMPNDGHMRHFFFQIIWQKKKTKTKITIDFLT